MKRRSSSCSWLLSVLSAAGLLSALLVAAGQTSRAQDQDQQDPPTRVARLNYMQGSVSYQPSGDQDWLEADVDRPLTTGDNLWADQHSRGEVHIGSTALRIGDQTGISFLNLNDQDVQVQLAQGSLEINVRELGPNEAYEIDAPNLAFSILRPGEYRFDVDPNSQATRVTVYRGQGTVTGGGQTYNITPGQSANFSGTNELSENMQPVPGPDDFENWARSREYREEHVLSARYVSPEMTGYEDLDEYGSWHSDSEYGNYWVPSRIDAGWEPYREGHWCWVAPWGWTWVDDEPWGFAPFHYGRWAVIGGGWGWVPGPVAVAPVYAPAVVGFVGGGGFGVAVSFGAGVGVGWFPLGPRDVFVPAYRVSPRYVEEINVSNTTVINRTTVVNVYNNYSVNHVTNVNYTYMNNSRAVTVVNRDAFVSGRPVARAAMQVNSSEIEHPRVVTSAELTPSRASIIGPAAMARTRPPVRATSRPLVTKMRPAPQAQPLGRPRPTANPNLSPAVLNRSGYSPQLQNVRATAAARAPARGAPPNNENRPTTRTQPSRPAVNPNGQPSRPFTPPNRPAESPNREPSRPFVPPNRPAENPNRQPSRPFVPPNRPAENPNREPSRPFTPPNRPAESPNREPSRPVTSSTEPRPEARPRQPVRPTEPPPRPENRQPATRPQPARPAQRPGANPRAVPQPTKPRGAPPKKQPPKPHPGNPGQS